MAISVEQILEVLGPSNSMDARAIAESLRRTGMGDVHKRDVNPVLYRRMDLFQRLGDTPPVWSLRTSTIGVNAPGVPAAGATADVRQLPIAKPTARHQPPGATAPTPPAAGVRSSNVGNMEPAMVNVGATFEPTSDPSPIPWPLSTLTPYNWQAEAYGWWVAHGSRGIVEAVTGTGKTTVGLAAIAASMRSRERVLLLVPTIVLQEQWVARMQRYLPDARVANLGGAVSDGAISKPHDVMVAVINSAANHAQRLDGQYACVIADECHRYGAPTYRKGLLDGAARRLGLTATLERLDEGVEEALTPYFGGHLFRYDFDRATSDRVLASFVVANVGVQLTADEHQQFDIVDELCRNARAKLIHQYGYPADIAQFMPAVALAAKTKITLWGEGRLARQYMSAFSQRIKILAETPARRDLLGKLAAVIQRSGGCLAFTETVQMADQAAGTLRSCGIAAEPFHSDLSNAERQIRLDQLKRGRLQAVVGVRALDEGVDVPDVNLGIIMSASRQKRQMVQRLGRIVRKKPDDRFAVLINFFANGTPEDPRQGAHEAFLDAITNGADDIATFPDGYTPALERYLLRYLAIRPGASDAATEADARPVSETRSRTAPLKSVRGSAPGDHVTELERQLDESRQLIEELKQQVQELRDKLARFTPRGGA
jgi:superfamily II DNA or RNA helicase